MGFFDFLTGGKSKVDVVADPYGSVRQPLNQWLSGQIGKSGPAYGGELTAPMSDEEKKSFEFLRKYGENGYGENFNQAKGEISKTLTGYYDPSTSPYYQAVKAQASQNLADTQKNIASNAAGGGRYWSGARLKAQSNAARDTNMGLNTMLGQMSENERQNRLNVIPQALGISEMEQGLPLKQAAAYQSLGALPRSIQQAGNTANYQDFLRREQDYPLAVGNLAAGVQTPPTYQERAPGFLEQLLGGMAGGAGSMLPFLFL